MTDTQYHITFDLETLGLKPTSVVLSLGAVLFDPYGIEESKEFYGEFDFDDQYREGRTVDPETIRWWIQPENAVFFPRGRDIFRNELARFFAWITFYQPTRIWTNGTDFDIPIVYDAAERYRYKAPWKYHEVRDVRTISKEVVIPFPTGYQKHHALSDAKANAEVVKAFYALQRGG